jgi:RNA recognition motif-containing protein
VNNKLYVGNLPFETSEDDLRELFSQAGAIRAITIPMDRQTNRPRGFAFVEMETPDDAGKAIEMFNGQQMDGRTMNVSEARPPENRGGGGGGGGNRDRGGYGDSRNSGGGGYNRDRGNDRGNDRRGNSGNRRY